MDVTDWLEKTMRGDRFICAKRLAYGDLRADDGSPGGLRLPRGLLLRLVPTLRLRGTDDPATPVTLLDPFGATAQGILGWHRHESGKGTQSELRLHDCSDTASPFQDPENTGALAVLAFHRSRRHIRCDYFVCRTIDEEDRVEDVLGPVEPD